MMKPGVEVHVRRGASYMTSSYCHTLVLSWLGVNRLAIRPKHVKWHLPSRVCRNRTLLSTENSVVFPQSLEEPDS